MTKERMIELLKIERECMRRGAHNECDRDCARCELVQDDRDLDEMYTGVIALLRMKLVRVEMVVYYEAQDSTSVEEAKDVVLDLAEMNGLNIQFCKAELIWDKPDND